MCGIIPEMIQNQKKNRLTQKYLFSKNMYILSSKILQNSNPDDLNQFPCQTKFDMQLFHKNAKNFCDFWKFPTIQWNFLFLWKETMEVHFCSAGNISSNVHHIYTTIMYLWEDHVLGEIAI